MKISIIVPAFNEEKLIAATLRSIQAAAGSLVALRWDTELVVCDNNSTDRTADLAREAGACVVFEKVNQIGRARNTGAAAATGDWLVFVDADSHPSGDLLAAVAAEIQTGCCMAGGSTLRLDGYHPVANFIAGGWNVLSRVFRYAPGSFIFCETAAFREVGGFSADLYASEEIELFRRLKRLARARRKQIRILHHSPLLTSARKLHLYTPWEHLRFLGRTFLLLGRPLKHRASCPTWYDGRR